MPLLYYPAPGEIVICHYGREQDVLAPEMHKSRPVVVVGPRLRRRGKLVTVVPLSTTEPSPAENYHCKFTLTAALPAPFDNPVMWAKCDMVSVVSIDRLDRFKESKSRYGGPRRWTSGKVSVDQLKAIRCAVLCGLGLGMLTKHL